jgi:hypothetical protein
VTWRPSLPLRKSLHLPIRRHRPDKPPQQLPVLTSTTSLR